MLTSRLDRCYSSSTHAPGYQIDYPPPPSVIRSANSNGNSLDSPGSLSNSSNDNPPPLPPKSVVVNPLASIMSHPSLKNNHLNQHGLNNRQLISGSGFLLGKASNLNGRNGSGLLHSINEVVGGNGNNENGANGVCAGTWSAGGLTPLDFKASSLLDSHDRFKPERGVRRPVQRMKWSSQSRWGKSLAGDLFSYAMGPSVGSSQENSPGSNASSLHHPNYYGHISLPPLPMESESRVSSMTIADVSPRLAVKKVLLLYEHAQYREAASFINRLSVGTFRIILRELPMDVFVEAMPHSLPILEALYAKIFSAEGPGVDLQLLKPEAVLMHMVKFFSREDINQPNRGNKNPSGPFTAGCKKILGVIVVAEPSLLKKLQQRGKTLDKVVEGMGQHGLVGTTDESIMPLHDALKLEFQRVVETYKGALIKLEELSLAVKNNPKSMSKGPAPVSASHQRQLSLRAEEIQERLIKNKSILNAVEPTLDNHCLDILLGILQRRVQVDKEALFQFIQLRKETGDALPESVVAPLLMRYSRGCKLVLEMMREVGKEVGACIEDCEDDSSDLSGYHSDSDSAIMTSGNSPFVTPRARYNFLSRSVRSKQQMRPSLLNSTWSAAKSMGSKSSGPGSTKSFGSSSFDSSLSGTGSPDELATNGRHLINPAHAATPVRPRHVKLKNQLHKNNSLGKVSTASSTGSDSSTSGCGTSLTTEGSPPDSLEGDEGLLNSPQLTLTPGSATSSKGSSVSPGDCVECVTVVSVPDNQVITQGVNHHCANGHHSPASSTTSTTDGDQTNSTSAYLQELRIEISLLKRQLQSANTTIYHMQEKGRQTQTNNTHQGLLRKVQSNNVEQSLRNLNNDVCNKEDKKAQLVREYGALYAQARVETMDALDALAELSEADELKSKLLFSVVVLAFRSVQTKLGEIKDQVSSLLQFDSTSSPTGKNHQSELQLQQHQSKLVEALSDYLSNSQQKFDQSRCVEHVASQLWTTLYDYPCLRKCEGLMKYIRTCVNLAWGLSNQTPACVLEYERRAFSRETHVRFHSSDPNSEVVKTYLWPALLEGPDGICIHKGVVIT